MAKIPDFKNLEEAVNFWDTHDFEDYLDDTEPVSFTVRIAQRRKCLTIPVPLKVFNRIVKLAAKRKRPVEELVSDWLTKMAESVSQ